MNIAEKKKEFEDKFICCGACDEQKQLMLSWIEQALTESYLRGCNEYEEKYKPASLLKRQREVIEAVISSYKSLDGIDNVRDNVRDFHGAMLDLIKYYAPEPQGESDEA